MLLLGGFSLQFIVALMLVLLVAVTVHEFAHNYVAYLMGDQTPVRLGKLTLNPMAHVFWQGWLMFLIIGFAPLGFAQIDYRQMRNPRWGYFAAVAAGPFSNLLLAMVFGLLTRIVYSPFQIQTALGGLPFTPGNFLALFLGLMVFYNLLLFMFNLLPLFPIDGWKMVWAVLPSDLAYTWQSWQTYSQYALFGLILISFAAPQLDLLGPLIFQPASTMFRTFIGA